FLEESFLGDHRRLTIHRREDLAIIQHLVSTRRGRGCRGKRGRISTPVNGPVAILATDFDRVADLSIELAVAMAVLSEMTIHAMHALFDVNVLQVNRHTRSIARPVGWLLDGPAKLICCDVIDYLVTRVEQVAFAVFLVNRAEDPSVAGEICELSLLELWINAVGQSFEKLGIAPFPSQGGFLRVSFL